MRSHQFSERISQFSIRSIISDFQCFGVRDWLSNLHPIASTVIAINSRIRNILTPLSIRVLSLQDFVGCLSNWNQVEGASISAAVRLAVIFGRLICHSSHKSKVAKRKHSQLLMSSDDDENQHSANINEEGNRLNTSLVSSLAAEASSSSSSSFKSSEIMIIFRRTD